MSDDQTLWADKLRVGSLQDRLNVLGDYLEKLGLGGHSICRKAAQALDDLGAHDCHAIRALADHYAQEVYELRSKYDRAMTHLDDLRAEVRRLEAVAREK